jgi:hypothetical protein
MALNETTDGGDAVLEVTKAPLVSTGKKPTKKAR